MSNDQSAMNHYEERIAFIRGEIERFRKLSKRLIQCRIVTAFPGLAMVVAGFAEPRLGAWVWQVGVLLIAIFLSFATWYETIQWSIQKLQSQLFGFERLISRCKRDWPSLPPLQADEHAGAYENEWTHDLDVFGDRSLFRWVSLAMTRTGVQTIASWLTQWTNSQEISERQTAVRELAAAREWRLQFFQIACGLRHQRTYPEAIIEWSEDKDFFEGRRLLYALSWVGPIALVSGIAALVVSLVMSISQLQIAAMVVALTGLVVNFLLTMLIVGPIHNLFNQIGHANRELQLLSDWVTCVREMPSQSARLRRIAECLLSNSESPSDAKHGISKLQRWMSLAGIQKSQALFIPYIVLQISVLWDVRVLKGLEGWKHVYKSRAGDWVRSLGELEALLSAATIADEYPNWAFPSFDSREAQLVIQSVAHPLLKDPIRVPNDLEIHPQKRLLLVTGSNMAGKSTLLRSVGLNASLGRLGAPVCCEKWCSESLDFASSIRVQDSLQDGVSFFMAELQRLRTVVDRAASQNKEGGHRMLVLLDEILQGTNSRERQIAVDSVLKKLVELGCIVMASTHDLDLASTEQMQRFAQVVHFREFFETVDGQQKMKFDYRMRPGVTPTTNALKLLEMVGLGAPPK